MKIFLYIILTVFMLSILLTPITEVFILCKERVLLSSTLYNSFRAARESGYSYQHMREIDAVADEDAFLRSFSRTFAASYGMDCAAPAANPLRFTSPDGVFNDFEIDVEFQYGLADGGAIITLVTITARSEYMFRTLYMRAIGYGDANPYMLQKTETYTMKVTN